MKAPKEQVLFTKKQNITHVSILTNVCGVVQKEPVSIRNMDNHIQLRFETKTYVEGKKGAIETNKKQLYSIKHFEKKEGGKQGASLPKKGG